ncbi:hypothetical protein PMAYCL1PPCAC_28365, partial [Pristionchus mayeri]
IDLNLISKTGITKTDTSPYIDLSKMGNLALTILHQIFKSHSESIGSYASESKKPVATPTTPLQLIRLSPEKKGCKCVETTQSHVEKMVCDSIYFSRSLRKTRKTEKTPSPSPSPKPSPIAKKKGGITPV